METLTEEQAWSKAQEMRNQIEKDPSITYDEAAERAIQDEKNRNKEKSFKEIIEENRKDFVVDILLGRIKELDSQRRCVTMTFKEDNLFGWGIFHPNHFNYLEMDFEKNKSFLGQYIPEALYHKAKAVSQRYRLLVGEAVKYERNDDEAIAKELRNSPEYQQRIKQWEEFALKVCDDMENFYNSCLDLIPRDKLQGEYDRIIREKEGYISKQPSQQVDAGLIGEYDIYLKILSHHINKSDSPGNSSSSE